MDKWLTPSEVSEAIKIPEKTLAKWRSEGTGPEYTKPGKHVRYSAAKVDAWMNANCVTPRSAA